MPKRDGISTKLLGIATRLVRKTTRHSGADEKPSREDCESTTDTQPQRPLLNHLFQSNSPPQDHEVQLIQECIARDTADRDRLAMTLELKDTQIPKTRLERQISSLDLAIQSCKSLLSPVRRLPADILLEIFGYILVPVTEISDLPWNLSHVCRYWRDVILGSSTIWRRFPVIAPATSEFAESRQVELLQMLSERAVQLFELRILSSSTDQFSSSVFSLLVKFSHKWKKLTISATLHTMRHISAAEDHLDSLEELTIHFLYSDGEEAGPTHNIIVAMFQNAPELQRVTLTGEFHGRISLPIYLTSLHDMSWGINAQERLLTIGRYEKLQDLCITDAEVVPQGSNGPDGSHLIELPQLTNLTLNCSGNVETGLLRFGVFPKLRSICIDARDGGSGDTYRMLAALLSRSNCGTVETLELDLPTSARNAQLSLALQMTPRLKKLRCYLPSDPDIQKLALYNTGEEILVPNLAECTFALGEPLHLQVTIDAIQSLIASRCSHFIAAVESGNVRSSGMVLRFRDYDNSTGYPSDNLVHAQVQFETWYIGWRGTPLFLVQQLLGHRLPNIHDVHPHTVPLSQSNVNGAIKILTRIESYEAENIKEVIISGAHILLARLRNLSSDSSVKENMFKPFRDQVLRVQDKWQTLMSDTSDIHWIWTCPALNEIQYVPDWSASRNDTNYLNKSLMAMLPSDD